MGDYDYPGVAPTPVGEEAVWFDHCRRRELVIQQCRGCSRHLFPPRSVCPHCLTDDPEWVRARGTGTVHTFTVQHRNPQGFEGQAPYTIAMVDLDEGVRMMTRIPGDPDRLAVGDPVEVRWADVADGVTVPVFVRSEEAPHAR
jgi:uncharacterized protein